MSASMKLALLLCDTPVPNVFAHHGSYLDIFNAHLTASLPTASFTLDGFDVVEKQQYPDLDAGYRGILISGSGACVFDVTVL